MKNVSLKIKHALVILQGRQMMDEEERNFEKDLADSLNHFMHTSNLRSSSNAREYLELHKCLKFTESDIQLAFECFREYFKGLIFGPIWSAIDGAKDGSWQFHDKTPACSLKSHLDCHNDFSVEWYQEGLEAFYSFTSQVHDCPGMLMKGVHINPVSLN